MLSRTLLLAALVGAITALSRLPFVTHQLWQWDSVLYARALEQGFHVDFVLANQRPHPPGYLFYIGVASMLRAVFGDSNAALVAVSVLGSALAVAAVLLLTARLAGTWPAVVVAAGFAANPLVWFYGEVAYPYTLLAFLSVALAWLFREARARDGRARVAASAAFGLLAGFRQDLLLLLLPLWLWMLLRAPRRETPAHVAAIGAASLVWFVPTALLSDGFVAYVGSVLRQTASIDEAYSVSQNGLEALGYNVGFTLYALAWGLMGYGLMLLVALGAPLAARLRARARPLLSAEGVFFALWILPALFVFVLVHIGEWGHVLSVLPGLYVLAGWLLPGAVRALRALRPLRLDPRAAWVGGAIALVLLPTGAFTLTDARFSAAAIAAHERAVAAKFAYVREHFAPDATVILAREDFLHVRHYLPEYKTWFYDPEPHDRQANTKKRVPNRATTIVLFTDGLQPMRPREMTEAAVAPGVSLRYFVVEPGQVVEFVGERFGIRDTLN